MVYISLHKTEEIGMRIFRNFLKLFKLYTHKFLKQIIYWNVLKPILYNKFKNKADDKIRG